MIETLNQKEKEKYQSRTEYWNKLYAQFLKVEKKDNSWKVRAICYQPWPLLFNLIMVFFEYYTADQIIKKCQHHFRAKMVLDVGCGTGRWCDYFQRRGARVIGTDLVPELLADNQASRPNCFFSAMSATHLALQSGSVDFINAAIIMEYVPNSRKADVIREFGRILCPEGYVLILDPVAGVNYQEREGTSLMTSSAWQELFSGNGFDIVAQKSLHAYPLTRPYKGITQMLAVMIKWLKVKHKSVMMGSINHLPPPVDPPATLLCSLPSVGTGAVLKTRHLLYHELDQMILRVIAFFSFPLEFVWLALGWKGSHEMFLIQKRPAAQS